MKTLTRETDTIQPEGIRIEAPRDVGLAAHHAVNMGLGNPSAALAQVGRLLAGMPGGVTPEARERLAKMKLAAAAAWNKKRRAARAQLAPAVVRRGAGRAPRRAPRRSAARLVRVDADDGPEPPPQPGPASDRGAP